MIDAHTHILPRMDDGARSSEQSLAMLRAEASQGVDTVVLTPHFYAAKEDLSEFLERRAASYARLCEVIAQQPDREEFPKLLLGAEVAWYPSLSQNEHLDRLCIEGTNLLLVEPPMARWDASFVAQMYDLIGCRGVTPMIAHIDRYFSGQKPENLRAIFALGAPIQISAASLTWFWTRKKALQCINDGAATVLISDCHDMEKRAPNLASAREVIARKLGADVVAHMDHTVERLLYAE